MGDKKINTSVISALSLSFAFGIASATLLAPNQASAGLVGKVKAKFEDQISDQQLANEYLRKNPEASQYMRDTEQEFQEKMKRAKSPKEIKRLTKERKNERQAELKMYADLERRDREMTAMKARDYSKAPIGGETSGMVHARRLAAQCGRGETVGYSNYFGDKSFYNQRYPLLGPEFADIEAIPVLRERMLPKFDSKVRKFFKDKQLTFTSMELNRKRSSTHSNIHESGGQKEYSDRILRESGEHHRKRSENLSEGLYEDLFGALKKFRHTFITRSKSTMSRYQRESGVGEVKRNGFEILAECRHYWAKGNTVRYSDPVEETRGGQSFYQRRTENRRIGIQPGFIVAEPVRPRGEPLAKQNLVESEYDKKINTRDVGNRASKYKKAIKSEDRNESADELIRKTFGDDYHDPTEFKTIEGGMSTSNGTQSGYQRNRDKEVRKSIKGSMVEDFSEGNKKKSLMKLDFNDIYR